MKSKFIGSISKISILLLFLIAVGVGRADAQGYGERIIKKANSYKYTIQDTVSFELKAGEVHEKLLKLEKGVEYFIVAFSDDTDIKDMDLYIYNTKKRVIAKDVEYGPMGVITYKPYVTKELKIQVKNFESADAEKAYSGSLYIFSKSK